MHYGNLGTAGVKVSRVALGCLTFGSKRWRPWVLEEEDAVALIKRALDHGINFFDTADFYSLGASEEVLGRALRRLGVPRRRVVIASKVGLPVGDDPNERGLSRQHIRHALEATLRRLGVDYLDLYQIHRFDAETPMDETVAALDEVVRSGKALYLGASSMPAWQFARLLARCDAARATRFSTMQSHYNLVYREEEREMIPLCVAEGVEDRRHRPAVLHARVGRGRTRARDRHRAPARRRERASGARLADAAARRGRAADRRHQGAPHRRCLRGGRAQARRGGNEQPRRRLPAASGDRAPSVISDQFSVTRFSSVFWSLITDH